MVPFYSDFWLNYMQLSKIINLKSDQNMQYVSKFKKYIESTFPLILWSRYSLWSFLPLWSSSGNPNYCMTYVATVNMVRAAVWCDTVERQAHKTWWILIANLTHATSSTSLRPKYPWEINVLTKFRTSRHPGQCTTNTCKSGFPALLQNLAWIMA